MSEPRAVAHYESPRDVSPRACRRSWGEPRVRTWWVLALAMAVTATALAVAQWLGWRHDTRLVRNGTLIQATLLGADRASLPGQLVAAGGNALIRFPLGGADHVVQVRLPIGTRSFYTNGRDPIPVYVDPANPGDVTTRLTVPPLAQEMIGPLILGPLAIVLALVTLAMRWQVLRTWSQGTAREAVVVAVRNSAAAPASRVLRCTSATGTDKRVFDVVVPKRQGAFAVNDKLWVVTPPNDLQPALPVIAYA